MEQYLHGLKTPFLGFSRDLLPPKKVVDGYRLPKLSGTLEIIVGHSLLFIGKIIILPLLDHFDGPHFFLVAEHLWKTPEMEFSDRVDIVLKKSRGKILNFRKIMMVEKN